MTQSSTMEIEIGPQYPGDEREDKSGFKRKARLHQSKFRAEILKVPHDACEKRRFGNYLALIDAARGLNFFDGFDLFRIVQCSREYSTNVYANMLRSEHIPYNFFIPFRTNFSFLEHVLRELVGPSVHSVDDVSLIDGDPKPNIRIEYKPTPKQSYLNDATAFDACIEYNHIDGSKGILGIEVKYTELPYKLGKHKEKEARDVKDPNSLYHCMTRDCKTFVEPFNFEQLTSDQFRQIWRNQLLGESILLNPKHREQGFKHFTSITFFPKDNVHVAQAVKHYPDLLANKERFKAITYEGFFEACEKHCPSNEFERWVDYLKTRYLVQ